jgi:hypothetical protein
MRFIASLCFAALVGFAVTPASAFTLSATGVDAGGSQIEKAHWRHSHCEWDGGHHHRHCRYW